MCSGFVSDRPWVDPRQRKKESERASKTEGFTWNAAILVVVSAGIPRGGSRARQK